MRRLIRLVLTLIIAGILIGLVALVGVVVFVNPNDLKPQISQAVKAVTGRALQIKQGISWSIFPWLGLQIHDAKLGNLPGFGPEPFAEVKKLAIQVRLLPLLHKQLEIGRLQIQDFTVHLVRNRQGQVNWQLKNEKSHPTPSKTQQSSRLETDATQKLKPLGFVIAGVDMDTGHVFFDDQVKQQHYELSNLSLKSANLAANKNTFFALQFALRRNHAPLATNVKLTSQINVAADGQTVGLHPLRLEIRLPDVEKESKSPPIVVETNARINLAQARLNAPELRLAIGQNQLLGNLTGEHLLKDPSWSGALHAQQIRWNTLTVQNIQLPFSFQNKTLSINPMQADFCQGHYQGDFTLYLNTQPEHFISHHQLTGLNLGLLYQTLGDGRAVYLSGHVNTAFSLASQGTQPQTLLKNLQGQGQFDLQNGAVHGINFAYWLAVGKALLQQKSSPPAQDNDTPFDEFGGHFILRNGVFINNDLLIRSGRLHILGKGAVNLVQQQVDYRLRAQPVQSDGSPDGLAIPLKITGSFNSLRVTPILDESSVSFIKDKIKNKLQERLKEWDLKKLFG
jgi:AsmA protein